MTKLSLPWAPPFVFVYLWCDVTGVVVTDYSEQEEDVGRGSGVQPYRFEPRRRSNNGDEESGAGELTLRYEN